MNKRIKQFIKFAEHHPIQWYDNTSRSINCAGEAINKTTYCAGIGCYECVHIHININELNLHDEDIQYIKEHLPEYFV